MEPAIAHITNNTFDNNGGHQLEVWGKPAEQFSTHPAHDNKAATKTQPETGTTTQDHDRATSDQQQERAENNSSTHNEQTDVAANEPENAQIASNEIINTTQQNSDSDKVESKTKPIVGSNLLATVEKEFTLPALVPMSVEQLREQLAIIEDELAKPFDHDAHQMKIDQVSISVATAATNVFCIMLGSVPVLSVFYINI